MLTERRIFQNLVARSGLHMARPINLPDGNAAIHDVVAAAVGLVAVDTGIKAPDRLATRASIAYTMLQGPV